PSTSSTSAIDSISPFSTRPGLLRVSSRCSRTRSTASALRVLEASRPRMRSESRTEDTSGLTTTIAWSAKYMARNAPFSIPAGESQRMYSKPSSARSLSTFSTPSLVSASLSRVCEAASTNRLSKRLSLISACRSDASPWTTLTKSYTTRRSQPMMRSRLRRPTSKSMTTTFLPRRARPLARLALLVVLPTPPLPEVTTMISAKTRLLCGPPSVECGDLEFFVLQPDLHRLAVQLLRDIFQHFVVPGHGDQFGVEGAAEDARRGVALGAGQRAPAQRAVDVDRAVGDHFRAGAYLGEHGQVPVLGVQLLARAPRGGLDQARGGHGPRGRRRRRGFGRLPGRRRRPGGRLGGSCDGLVLGPELGQQRQPELDRQGLVVAAAPGQCHRQHAGAAQRLDQRPGGGRVRGRRQAAEVQDHRRAREQPRRALHP